jgi:hypothetical protein
MLGLGVAFAAVPFSRCSCRTWPTRCSQLEVYLFGPAEHALLDAANTYFNSQIDALIEHGVPVRTCLNIAAAAGAADQLAQRGIQLEFARDAFVRYGQDAAAVISF